MYNIYRYIRYLNGEDNLINSGYYNDYILYYKELYGGNGTFKVINKDSDYIAINFEYDSIDEEICTLNKNLEYDGLDPQDIMEYICYTLNKLLK